MNYDELIIRSLQGRISDADEQALQMWRQANAEHEARYQVLAALWRATSGYREGPPSAPVRLAAITSEAKLRRERLGRSRRRRRRAAAMAAIFVAGFLGIHHWVPREAGRVPVGEVVTGVGETTTARLPDGTIVRLAPESQLVLFSPGKTREVSLEGRAFFAVASDPEKPFLVRAPSGQARVLGTRFELDAREGGLRLIVVEGRVALGSGGREVNVGTRQVAHLREGEDPLTVDAEDVWPLLAWMGGFLAFESTPLHEVRSELYDRFNVDLTFEDPTLAEETVTVWFGDEPIEEIVSVLCRLLETQCTVEDSTVRMARKRHGDGSV